jgi:glycosyltransferase involved in cell wall biosynthesis
MACGLPIVAANCASGPSEILLDRPREQVEGLVHGPAGAVVPPNDPFTFAEAMREVLDPGLRAARGAAACELSRRFSVERTAQHYWAIIEEAVRAREESRSPAPREDRSARKAVKMGEGVS